MYKDVNGSNHIVLDKEKLILKILKDQGPSSHQRIREIAGLPRSTVSDILKKLRQQGLIFEKKGKSQGRGPKPIIVNINPQGSFSAGVAINPTSLFIGLIGLNTPLIETDVIPIKTRYSPVKIARLIQKSLFNLMEKHNIPIPKLTSLGILIYGIVDTDGVIKSSSPLQWKNTPFKQILSDYFNCFISVGRINLKDSYPELENLPYSRKKKVILFTVIGDGVGGGIIVNGEQIHGGSNRHCEIGHIIIDPNGPVCGCGNKGCLESFVSGPALSKRIKDDIKEGAPTILRRKITGRDTSRDIIDKWGQAIINNDSYALKLLDLVCEYFGKVMAISVNCYDPDIIIIRGYVANQCSDYLIEKIKEKINNEVVDGNGRNIEVFMSQRVDDVNHLVKCAARTALWQI